MPARVTVILPFHNAIRFLGETIDSVRVQTLADWRLLLFVRRSKRDDRGITRPFLFLGPVRYVSHEGERPMSITWQLDHPVPGDWFQQVKIAAG